MLEDASRQNLIIAAVDFLQNPQLIRSPLKDKLKFLQDKGLSELEIDEAINSAVAGRQSLIVPTGKWNMFFVAAFAIGGYQLYRMYLNYRHEEEKIKNVVIQKPMTLVDIMTKMNDIQKTVEGHRQEFKAEIRSLRSLMLGHEKFTSPPTIPSWQLSDDMVSENDTEASASTNLFRKPVAILDQ